MPPRDPVKALARLSPAFSSRRQTTTRRASHFTHSSTKDHCLWSSHLDSARTGFLAVVEGNRIFAPMHGACPRRRCCRIQSARAAFITLASFYCEVLSWTGALHHRGSASRNAPAAIPTPFATPARSMIASKSDSFPFYIKTHSVKNREIQLIMDQKLSGAYRRSVRSHIPIERLIKQAGNKTDDLQTWAKRQSRWTTQRSAQSSNNCCGAVA